MNYFNLFSQIISELIDHSLIKVQSFELRSGLEEEDLAKIEQELQIELVDEIKDFYSQLNKVCISWYVSEETVENELNPDAPEELVGEIHIQNLYVALGMYNYKDKWPERFGIEFMPADEKALMLNFIPFDFFNPDESECVGFIKRGNKIGDQLGYFSLQTGFFDLEMNLATYIETLVETKGFMEWRNANLFETSERRKLSYYLPKLFQGTKLTARRYLG